MNDSRCDLLEPGCPGLLALVLLRFSHRPTCARGNTRRSQHRDRRGNRVLDSEHRCQVLLEGTLSVVESGRERGGAGDGGCLEAMVLLAL